MPFNTAAAEPSAPRAKPQPQTDSYLGILEEFIHGNDKTREKIYEWVSTNAVLDPIPQNRLRLALLKAWPGHAGHNPQAAELLLKSVLNSSRINSGVRNLAAVFLAVTEEQQKRIQQNQVLLTELEEVRNKLNALTTIERTVDAPVTAPDQTNGRESTENSTHR
jgi:hypothetical protein